MMDDEVARALQLARDMLNGFAESALEGKQGSPEQVLETSQSVISILFRHGMVQPGAGRRPSGLGYDFDEAQIVASIEDHNGSLENAVRAHWQREDGEWLEENDIEAIIKTIRRRTKAIEEFEKPDP